MKAGDKFKRFIPLIVIIIFGAVLFLSAFALEFNMYGRMHKNAVMSKRVLMCILSDSFLVSGIFITGTALIGVVKYVNIGAVLYSAFTSIRQFVTLGFIPKGCRKAYRKFRKETKEEKGTGMAEMLVIGFALITVALILLFIYKKL